MHNHLHLDSIDFILNPTNISMSIKPIHILLSALVVISPLIISNFVTSSTESLTGPAQELVQYLQYLRKFNKEIPEHGEFIYRAGIYGSFVKKMIAHNENKQNTYLMGINQFSDLTREQFMETYLGERPVYNEDQIKVMNSLNQDKINIGFAGEIDWRNKNIITAVKNQGQCGSCWAFAATAAHESYQVQLKQQPLTISLSEQQLVDCSTGSPYDNAGCNGGFGVRGLEYIKDHGQTTTDKYPYVARNQNCAIPDGTFRVFGVAEATGCSEIEELMVRRPLAVRVDASNWHTYGSGVFNNCQANHNHAVFMVGTSDSAWTIKNSWGPTWGESGYIRLAKGNTCGVCFGPSFPI